ncbi:MAG TPA: alanine--glyoxylate aminotransferase family protein [Vicinamibacteria bacterium]|nr:alanine--glyoxylate aminotransferase family protein [Vicinamibacteria bacterium]
MKDDVNLRIPGPTPCPREVREALSRPMSNHRGAEMRVLVSGLYQKLSRYLETSHEIFLLTASGTGGLEAAVANLMSPGDRVLGVSAGVFGERFCAIASELGCDLKRLSVEWGKAAEPEELRKALRAEKNLSAVLLAQNETSTGVALPIDALAKVVKEETDALLVVDAISSLGAMPLPMEGLGVDLVITGSQKAWGVPPGMSMLFLGARALEAMESAKTPRFYFDLRRYRKARDQGNFPFTPAISLLYALDVALDLLLKEGAPNVHARHRRVAEAARRDAKALGLELFAEERFSSPTVTAIRLPSGIDEPALMERLRTKHRTVLARGQERLMGRIVRVGHLGFVEEPEIRNAISSLGIALREMGVKV